MDIEKKHLLETNKKGLLAVILVGVAAIIPAALTLMMGFFLRIVILIVGVLIVEVANAILYNVSKGKEVYCHLCCACLIVIYLLELSTFRMTGTYAIAYPIAVSVLIFGKSLITISGSALAIVGTLVHDILCMVKFGTVTLADIILHTVIIVVTCIMASVISKMQARQSREKMEEVEAGSRVQIETTGKVVGLAGDLNNKFEQAKSVSDSLNASMQSTHSTVYDISESSKVTASAIEQQTGQTADIQQNIQHVASEAKLMGEISDKTNATVDEGVDLIHRLRSQAEEVVRINSDTKATTEQLNASIQDVQAITATILGISSQTNLLALNASIEAARAGEAGKGFAVVADEIRQLSEQTRKATEEITTIIERLTKDAENAVVSMDKSAEYADMQNALIEETEEKLANIKEDTDELAESVVQINASVERVEVASQIIMDNISNLSATSQEVAASTESAFSVSDKTMSALEEMNGLLEEIKNIAVDMTDVAH